MLGLYVHVPFCAAICNYCNFNRGLFDAGLKDRYLAAVVREIQLAGDGAPADTIFFGGGTPSLLEPAEIGQILGACGSAFTISGDAEITLEANPETVTADRLAGFREVGINRLSFGVQSFRDDELRRLSRLHSADRAREAVAMARAAGFDNVSLDLMMWLPQQSLSEWLESVKALIDLGPEHASMYLLEIYPNAPLRDAMARSNWSVAPEDDAADMYTEGLERLESAGYMQYEISNAARPGRESRHNLKYWTDGEWLGFGPGAHSTRSGSQGTALSRSGRHRWKNVSATSDYVLAIAGGDSSVVEHRLLSRRDALEEALFMGLRLSAGIDMDLVESKYGCNVWRQFGDQLKPFVDDGLLIYDGARMRLTRAGMLVANEIMAVFIN